MENKPVISLCMIVKNEEQLLAQALNSVKDLVDEMIIVDTGSTDKTVEIAKSFDGSINSITKKPISVKIIYFPWINDFSAARNESLKHASGDWILVLDADEIITDITRNKLEFMITEAEKNNFVGFGVVSRHYKNEITEGLTKPNSSNNSLLKNFRFYYDDKWKTRLFMNSKHIYYQGLIHEDVNPSIAEWEKRELNSTKKLKEYLIKEKIKEKKIVCNTPLIIHHLHYQKGTKFVEDKQVNYFELTKRQIQKTPNCKLYFDLAAGYLFYENNIEMALNSLLNAKKRLYTITNEDNINEDKIIAFITEKDFKNALLNILESFDYKKEDGNVLINVAKGFFKVGAYDLTVIYVLDLQNKVDDLQKDRLLFELLAMSYAQLEELNHAVSAYEAVRMIVPKDQKCIVNLAALYEKTNRYDKAIEMFSKLIAMNHPQSTEIQRRIDKLKTLINTY